MPSYVCYTLFLLDALPIYVYLLADYVSPERLAEITAEIESNSFVEEVTYDKPLIELLHDNVSKITFWILIVSGAFLVISILLINSSIRLSVYSKRFVIKTMQMVGATKMFIRRPFIWKNIDRKSTRLNSSHVAI